MAADTVRYRHMHTQVGLLSVKGCVDLKLRVCYSSVLAEILGFVPISLRERFFFLLTNWIKVQHHHLRRAQNI